MIIRGGRSEREKERGRLVSGLEEKESDGDSAGRCGGAMKWPM